ncbi:MAG TPA: alkaline phosphatase family protein [Stellaceae bacterium]|nr:alkaline phosphatase family protein [Stellaceae bacterium]
MQRVRAACAGIVLAGASITGVAAAARAAALPKYDHIVVVIDENKDFDQIVGNSAAPYVNRLAAEGALLTRMFGEEHNSQGNYFWLFSGSNQNVGFDDKVPKVKLTANNLGAALIAKGLSFKGYSQALPAIGSEISLLPIGCVYPCLYGRKHVPWISFANVPNGTTAETSSNLRFDDFPTDYNKLPTVAFVIPDLEHDMHNGKPEDSIPAGDQWLKQNLDPYYQWAKTHNSLLIVTFDENDDKGGYKGLTDPAVMPDHDRSRLDLQNRIATIVAGAHVKPGYRDAEPLTHVNLLRTIEAIYGLEKSGAQQPNALRAGIADAAAAGAFTPSE